MAIEWCQVCGSSVWSGQPCGKCAHDGVVATRAAEIARLNLRVAQLTSGSEAANLAGRVVEQDREIARLKAELTDADQVTQDALGHARAAWEGERKRLEADLAAHKRALVVDPFCGGGTTALACAIEGRRCITSEMDPVTFEKAKARLSRGFTPSMFQRGPRVKAKQGSLV